MAPATSSPSPRRIQVVGTSGSGKTTLARELSRRLGIPHVEMDSIAHSPGWQPTPESDFRVRLEEALAGPAWVVDGNYGRFRDLVWPRLELIVWLDFSLPVTFGRVLGRTLRRLISQEELWNGNRESFRMAFLSRESILLWTLTTHGRRRRQYGLLFAERSPDRPPMIRLRSAPEVRAWLESLPPACPVEAASPR